MPDDILKINLGKILGALEEPSTQQLALYIPDKDKDGKKIKHLHNWIKEAQKVLTLIGGGSTTMPPADGTWLRQEKSIDSIDRLNDKDMLWEKTTVMYTYIYPARFVKNLKLLRKFLHKFGRETNQGEVVFEFDGQFFRIRKYDSK
ncbi:MAG: hypothetical protein ACE5WD_13395 [Candidatus Aminicenantia bacterium]